MSATCPLTETEEPKLSAMAPSEAVSFCCSLQPDPARLNTYTEPEFMPLSSSYIAPTRAVSPLTETA